MAITIDISTGIDGLWTIQDNGNPADGISEVRDPNGAFFTAFFHPADSVTLLSRAGQNVTVNFIESLGTANFTIGSVTSTTVRPDAIFVGQVSSSGIVTLTANQTITESGGDGATDINASTLLLDAGTGIGTAGNPIETQVGQVEGESVTGGISLSNVGDVQIGGATAELRGLFTGTSGDITFTNQGTISLADTTGSQTIASAGEITLTAIGASADITSTVNNDALFALGSLSLSAGQDILFGTGGALFDNDVRAGGGIFVTAGRDFHIDGNADMLANDAGTSSNGNINVLVGRDILIEDETGSDASIGVSTGSGSIVLATGAGNTLSVAAGSASSVFAGSGGVLVIADRVLIEGDSGITTSGAGSVRITGATAGRNIILGSATDAAAAVELSDAELDRLFTQNAIIGNSSTGQLAVQAAITHPNANLTLESGSDVLVQANIGSLVSLTLRAGDTVSQLAASTITTGALSTFVDTPDLDVFGGQSSFGGTVSVTSSTITGNAGPDTLGGTNDDDRLVGGGGSNTLDGGGGEDVVDYSLAPGPVVVDLDAGTASANGFGATDLLFNIEKVFGSAFDDVLTGDEFANSLRGGAGADQLAGGDGDDTYGVDNEDDTVSETSAAGGTDTVRSSISYTLGANVENLVLIGTSAINGTGNALVNNLTGNNAANTLNGGAGADQMKGDAGNDSYIVDNVGDVVIENSATDGTDTVRSSLSYTLGINLENLVLIGAAAINGTGNTLANNLTGNNSANTLNGGVGADQMKGDGGDDTYIVDNLGDVVIENSAVDGTDTVRSSVTFSLAGQFLERLVLTGSAAIDGTGNGLDNNLTGNSAANILNGGMGADRMKGDAGDDTYVVDNAGDLVIENSPADGIDTVQSNVGFTLGSFVEHLLLTGAAAVNGTGNGLDNVIIGNNAANLLQGLSGADTLSGAGGADTLEGGVGDDKLYGGAGHDDLTGGAGIDGYRFDTTPSAASNVDDIIDFSTADDAIFLDRDIFTGIAANGILAAGAFRNGTAALDADDRILYDSATGRIFYDADGLGGTAAILFATVTPGLALNHADFVGYT